MAEHVHVRLARSGEAPALGELCVRSKAYWGYDAEFMRLSRRSLQIDPTAIDAGRVFVAIDERGDALGVADCCALPELGAFDLLHLFVDPRALRRGVGRALFEAACAWCVAQGGTRLVILSDPNAGRLLPAAGREIDRGSAVGRGSRSGLAAARVAACALRPCRRSRRYGM